MVAGLLIVIVLILLGMNGVDIPQRLGVFVIWVLDKVLVIGLVISSLLEACALYGYLSHAVNWKELFWVGVFGYVISGIAFGLMTLVFYLMGRRQQAKEAREARLSVNANYGQNNG